MFKKLFSVFILFCLFTRAEATFLEEFPREFFVKQHWLSWTTTFDIETAQMKLGTVHRKFLSLSPVRYDYNEILQASATMRWLSWGATFDVFDANNGPIGTVEQRIFTFFPTFEIHSPQGYILAIATMNFWGTTYTIRDPVTQEPFATLWRPFFRFKDDWTVILTNPDLYLQKQIDPRLFILVTAFQTDKDAWAAERNRVIQDNLDIFNEEALAGPIARESLKPRRVFRKQLEGYRSKIGALVATEAELASADQKVTEKLQRVDAIPKNDLDRFVKGFAVIQPLLESEEVTVAEKNALLTLFEINVAK
jgi:uncharacterized protein YxjI